MRKIGLFSLCLAVILCLAAIPLTALALDSTITADAVFVDTQVRFKDSEDGAWQDSIDAEIGDEVEYQITYQNTSDSTQTDVVISDSLPTNMQYVAGSTVLYNVNHPNGLVLDTDAVVADNGINIGAYTAGSNAYIRFTAKVEDVDLAWGSNTLVNWGQVSVDKTMLQDHAEVVVQNNTPIYILCTIMLALAICFGAVFIILRLKIHKKKRYL